jgi:hypothetical protein
MESVLSTLLYYTSNFHRSAFLPNDRSASEAREVMQCCANISNYVNMQDTHGKFGLQGMSIRGSYSEATHCGSKKKICQGMLHYLPRVQCSGLQASWGVRFRRKRALELSSVRNSVMWQGDVQEAACATNQTKSNQRAN